MNLFFRLRVFFIFPIVCPLLHPRIVGKFTASQQELRKCQPLECRQGAGDAERWDSRGSVGPPRYKKCMRWSCSRGNLQCETSGVLFLVGSF